MVGHNPTLERAVIGCLLCGAGDARELDRADFTDRPLQYVDFGELLRQRMEIVLPMTRWLGSGAPVERVVYRIGVERR